MAYGSQNSTTGEIIDDALSIHAVLLRRDTAQLAGVAVDCVEAADQVARAVGWLAENLASAAGLHHHDPRNPVSGTRQRATETAYGELDVEFRRWLAGLTSASVPMESKTEWHERARRVAESLGRDLMDRAPALAWAGRPVNGRLQTSSHAWARFGRDLRAALALAYPPA
jgi:CRISPR system Cascade subunit CasA